MVVLPVEKQAREGQTGTHSRRMKRNSKRHRAQGRRTLARNLYRKDIREAATNNRSRGKRQQVEEEERRPDAHDACCRGNVLQHRVHQNDCLALTLCFIHLSQHTSGACTLGPFDCLVPCSCNSKAIHSGNIDTSHCPSCHPSMSASALIQAYLVISTACIRCTMVAYNMYLFYKISTHPCTSQTYCHKSARMGATNLQACPCPKSVSHKQTDC